jgi:N6-adenosine-specific RNA methylase IME4
MSSSELESMALPPIADDAHLFLWRVASMQQEALDLVMCWGFVPKAEIVWIKRTVNGKRAFGMGRQVRMEHEICIIATRGRPKTKSRSVRSTFEAQVGAHSQKPDALHEIVETLCHGPYLEMFARRRRAGWTCMGNEVPDAVDDQGTGGLLVDDDGQRRGDQADDA